jgi:outer membrane protein X
MRALSLHRLVAAAVGIAWSVAGAGLARAQAEDYEPFRFDSGLTGTYVSSNGRGGFGAVMEPKVLIHDQVAIGARFEAAVMFGGNIGAAGDVKMDMGAAANILAKGEYLVSTSAVRPFVGLGLGFYSIGSQSISTGSMSAAIDQKGGRYFGIAPQLGIDLGRVRLAATYNAILRADIEVHQVVGGAQQTASFSQNYLTFEMSFRFGGDRMARQPPATPVLPARSTAAPGASPGSAPPAQ